MKKIFRIYIPVIISAALILLACEEDKDLYKKKFTDESLLLITEYLDKNENTTMMTELLKAGKKDALLNTYGNYTVFAPVDSAFSAYLNSIGKSNIHELDSNEVAALIDFHVILNYIDVKAKITGILGYSDTTISGIRHFIDLSEGFGNIIINKNSLITSIIETSNGLVYLLDNVLTPHPNNIYDYLASTGNFTIFTAAIEASGLKDTLQKLEYPFSFEDITGISIKPYYTVFAEPDQVFKTNGINSVDDLKNSVWSTNFSEASTPEEALSDFIQYHFVSGQRSTFSLFKDENIGTLGMNKTGIIHIDESSDIRKPVPVLNSELLGDGSTSGGIKLNDLNSDVSCKNGLIHQLEDGILYINTDYRQSTIIKECEDVITTFQTRNVFIRYFLEFNYGGRGDFSINTNQQFYSAPGEDIGSALGFTPIDIGDWIEFKIRNVVPGNYRVKINYYRDQANSSQNINIYFRNEKDDFSWETQLFKAKFDMAQQEAETPIPSYRQDHNLGTISVSEYGNYIFRFAHADTKYGVYDNIILEPITE